jgi:hypothetical protein
MVNLESVLQGEGMIDIMEQLKKYHLDMQMAEILHGM